MIAIHAVILLLTYFPMYFMLISSLKNNDQISANCFLPTFPLRFENYSAAFFHVVRYLGNSIIVSGGAVIGIMICGSMSAYICKIQISRKKCFIYFNFVVFNGSCRSDVNSAVCFGKQLRT